ncbi:MAG: non-canonical purine NTP pyrophosphatase, RdgB/HAM1 family [Flammeovirgaceae bacterium]|nr:non-canonical purine NTP pyrophosphatase, RdgB/HAM1 family [Flammeovirgaceae bacterium]|tara:strand:+ start:3175 stop:3747 length:573 start_codon:yes stop_codon:yes gene_type:complete
MKLCFVTNNKNKLSEVSSILKNVKIISLEDISFYEDILETGSSLKENSELKAKCIYEKFNIDCFADDTGLEIDFLNGEPGVYSARYAGNRSNSKDNIDLVLKKMKNSKNRNAHFRTIITLYLDSKVYFFDGSVSGTISYKPIGNFGFGYDSIFIPQGYDITFAQMSGEAKNKISHRKKAIEKLNMFLLNK